MPAGLQSWNSSGRLTTDVGQRVGVILGSVNPGTTSGSITVPGLTSGTPFYIVNNTAGSDAATNGYFNCVPSISGTTLSWTFPNGYKYPCLITFGVR